MQDDDKKMLKIKIDIFPVHVQDQIRELFSRSTEFNQTEEDEMAQQVPCLNLVTDSLKQLNEEWKKGYGKNGILGKLRGGMLKNDRFFLSKNEK